MPRQRMIIITILSLCLGGFVAVMIALGMRIFFVTTPSMATAAPVGSLVITQPASSYHPGDIITFRRHGRTYTHRIQSITNQRILTKGDLNHAADPLPIEHNAIIGKAIFINPWLGWVWLMVPWVVIGWLIIHLATRRARPAWRWYYRIIGMTLVLCVVSLWFHPWINFSVLSVLPSDKGALMHIVNTGVFPIDAVGTVLYPGQDTTITVSVQNSHGQYFFMPTIHYTAWVVLCIMLICLIPFGLMLYGLRQLSRPTPADSAPQPLPVTSVIVAAIITLVGICFIIFHNFYLTSGAFSGTIRNSANTARPVLYNCTDATKLTAPSQALFIYGMTFFDTGTTERDLSGNNNKGTWLTRTAAAHGSQSYACRRDRVRSTLFKDTCLAYPTLIDNPTTFTLSVWFNTNQYGLNNGRIAGFASTPDNGADPSLDRVLFLDKQGRIAFAVWPNATRSVFSPAGKNYADGKWHHVAASLSPQGMRLYADGALVAHDPSVTQAQNFRGYWKFGCGRFSEWRNGDGTPINSTNTFFTGMMQFGAVHTTALSDAQVQEIYLAGTK